MARIKTVPILVPAVLILAATVLLIVTREPPPESEVFLGWVSDKAIALDLSDPMAVDLKRLERFDPYLEGKRIVFLGEPDHYVREKLNYQVLLVRYLHGKGFRHIGVESGAVQGRMVDRYIETGERSHLERYERMEDIVRPDRDDLFPILRAVLNSEHRPGMRDAGMWFLNKLYEIGSGPEAGSDRIHFFGFDLEPVPHICYGEIDLLLKPWRSSPEVTLLLRTLELVEGESRLEEQDRIESILSDVRNGSGMWEGLIGADRMRQLDYLLRLLSASLENLDLAFTTPSLWLPDREEKTKRNLDELLASLPENEKVILMAHNLHLARRSEEITWNGAPLWPMIGTHLSQTRGDEIYSIWMLYDHGHHGRVSVSNGGELIVEEVASDTARVGHLLARAGPAFLLPFGAEGRRNGYLNQRLNFVQNGQSASAVLREQTDAIFFVSEVSFIGERIRP